MDSRFLLQCEGMRDESQENLRLTEQVDESNLENTREGDEENLRFIEEDGTSKGGFEVPHGYWFHPTAVELMEEYLIKKILRQLTWDIIKEINFYQLDPQQIPMSEFEALKFGGEGKAYYFTSEEQKYVEGSRLMPRPCNGYWKRCGREVPIHNGVEIIGFKRRFMWEDHVHNLEESNWKMTEYSVTPRFMATNLENYLLCKVRDMNKYKKHLRIN